VVAHAPFPSEPFRYEDWVVVPAEQDSSAVPARALRRVQDIFAAGLRPVGFVVVHEAPKLLPAPADDEPKPLRLPAVPTQVKRTLKVAGAGLGMAGAALVVVPGLLILAGAVLSLAAAVALPALLLVGAVVVDPILVAVTEDGWWIEIDRWDT
jgi:hypothetical protein